MHSDKMLITGHMTKGPDTRAIEIRKEGPKDYRLRIEGRRRPWVDYSDLGTLRRDVRGFLERFRGDGWVVAVAL